MTYKYYGGFPIRTGCSENGLAGTPNRTMRTPNRTMRTPNRTGGKPCRTGDMPDRIPTLFRMASSPSDCTKRAVCIPTKGFYKQAASAIIQNMVAINLTRLAKQLEEFWHHYIAFFPFITNIPIANTGIPYRKVLCASMICPCRLCRNWN